MKNSDMQAILDEADDPAQAELDAALDEVLDSVHLAAPAVALRETKSDDETLAPEMPTLARGGGETFATEMPLQNASTRSGFHFHTATPETSGN